MAPADPQVRTAHARRAATRPLAGLPRERIDDVPATDPSDVAKYVIDGELALIEQAKGALMLFYGVDSDRAFGVLLGWARMSRTPVPTIAHTLMHGICEGDPQASVRQPALMRWLEAQLRHADPGHAHSVGRRPIAHRQETPRSG